jgi:hypothetical protein
VQQILQPVERHAEALFDRSDAEGNHHVRFPYAGRTLHRTFAARRMRMARSASLRLRGWSRLPRGPGGALTGQRHHRGFDPGHCAHRGRPSIATGPDGYQKSNGLSSERLPPRGNFLLPQ